jgi:hypothetical protein
MLFDDDLTLTNDFLPAAIAAIEARPNELVSFTNHMPSLKSYHAHNMRWATSDALLASQTWALPTPLLREFLEWRSECLNPSALEFPVGDPDFISCDGLVNIWALATDRRIFHTIPALVLHNVDEMGSTYGNDGDWGRRSIVLPTTPLPMDWAGEPVHLRSVQNLAVHGLLKHIKPAHWEKFNCVEKFYARYGGRTKSESFNLTEQPDGVNLNG